MNNKNQKYKYIHPTIRSSIQSVIYTFCQSKFSLFLIYRIGLLKKRLQYKLIMFATFQQTFIFICCPDHSYIYCYFLKIFIKIFKSKKIYKKKSENKRKYFFVCFCALKRFYLLLTF